MSSNFWHDVREFHHLLNLAHDGVLTTTELTVTFPKVLEGTFGSRGTQLSPTQYKDALEAYLSRLYSGAYPDYFIRKIGATRHKPADLNSMPVDPRETRNQLPLLLPHFEKDFLTGLSKEEEAVLHVDLVHSIQTLKEYYRGIDQNVELSVQKALPIFIRGLINTTYLPEPTSAMKVVDLQLHLDHVPLKMEVVREEQDPNDFEKTLKFTRAHIPISGIRLLVVAICTLLYDCPKIKTILRSCTEEPLKSIFAGMPDLLQPGHSVTCDGVEFDDAFTTMQSLIGGQQRGTNAKADSEKGHLGSQPGQNPTLPTDQGQIQQPDQTRVVQEAGTERTLVAKFSGAAPTTITASPDGSVTHSQGQAHGQGQGQGQRHLGLSPLAAKLLTPITSEHINIIFKYCLYGLSSQAHLAFLLANKGTVYNPLIDDDGSKISEASCNDPKKSEKEREVLTKIRAEQIESSRLSRKSRTVRIVKSFSLQSLLNIIFRLFSPTLDITRSIVSINDYIGEVTYGEDEEDDLRQEQEEMMAMMMMGMGSSGAAANDPQRLQSMQNFLSMMNAGITPKEPEAKEEPSTGTTATKSETNILMNAKWLFPIRASIDWSQAFVNTKQLTTNPESHSHRQLMLMGKLGSISRAEVARATSLHEEQELIARRDDYDLASHMRSR